MKELIERKVEINTVFPIPMRSHVLNSFLQYFDSVLQYLTFFIEWYLSLADFMHKNILFELCIMLQFARFRESL